MVAIHGICARNRPFSSLELCHNQTDPFGLAGRSLLFPENGRRPRVSGLPIEEIMNAGPGVDLGLANLAVETAGTRVFMFLFCRNVIEPAIGAGEMFGRPYATGHSANMRCESPIFQHRTLPQLMTHYPRKGLAPVWDLRPINLRPHRPTRIKMGCCSWAGRRTIQSVAPRTNVN
jgi:hypothetical protein